MSLTCFLTTPPEPILVESSRGPAFYTASTKTLSGFNPVNSSIISKAERTILMASAFLPCVAKIVIY
jgi:hypothetical protein